MVDESYAESIRKIVLENNIAVVTLDKLKELTLIHRQEHGLLRPDDLEVTKSGGKKWEGRTRSAIMTLRRNGEAALIDRAKYRFFI